MTDKPRQWDNAEATPEGALFAPAAARNIGPIIEELGQRDLPKGRALEIASGTGQHIVALAQTFPDLIWQPSDLDPERLRSVAARKAAAALPNLLDPIELDASQVGWSRELGSFDLIYLTNLLHLISAEAASQLLGEVKSALAPGGMFILYGPFLRDGQATSVGDAEFHARLQANDPMIGYKDIAWIGDQLAPLSLTIRAMPANNLMILADHR